MKPDWTLVRSLILVIEGMLVSKQSITKADIPLIEEYSRELLDGHITLMVDFNFLKVLPELGSRANPTITGITSRGMDFLSKAK